MSCPTLHRLILTAVISLSALAATAAPHQEIAPMPAEAVQAVRDAQHGRPDPMAMALDRHLREGLELADRGERAAAKFKQKSAKALEIQTALASRQAEAAAKRQEMLILRDEVLARLDREAEALTAQGKSGEASQAVKFKQKLATRFNTITQDLDDLSKADKTNLDARAKRAANRIKSWLAARPVEPLPQPNWKQAEPVAPIALPPARNVPSFVSDAAWLMQQKIASRNGFVQVALRDTPAEATACGYAAGDLADTAEAPKAHPDIVALAKQLDYNPVRMFEWVNQNIKFEPYYGSMKGAVGTLWSKSGGATDQASLLAALLRASNIPVRYVRGNISVLDNAALGAGGRGPRWVGAKSYQAAASVLANNGNPSAGYGSNSISLAHVWVEACLPYAAYRGTALDDSGHRWVPLDPSYKDQRYQTGVAVDGTFDFNYSNWLASRLDANGNYTLPQEAFEDQVATHAKTKAPNYANTTLEDVPYKSEIKRQRYDILPIVPPYEVLQYTSWSGVANESAETAALPERHKYRLLVAVKKLNDSLLAQKTLDLAELASKRLTLSFKGATPTDQTAFDTWFNAVDPAVSPTCATTVNMVPSIKLEGAEQTSEAGSGNTLLCSKDNKLTLTVTLAELGASATRANATYANIGAANLHALHAYAWHTSDTYLAKRSDQLLTNVRANSSNPNADRDGIEGEFLNIAASKYSRYVADANQRVGGLFGESGTLGTSLGLTAAQVKVNYLFDLPYGLFRKGFLIDWPGNVSTSTRLDTPSTTDKRAFKLSGFAASAYEAYIWNEVANLDAISTTRGLQFADEQNIEILQINTSTDWTNNKCKLTNTCASGALNTNPAGTNYSASHVSQIETQYVNQGYKLTIPRRLLQYPDASGWLGATFYGEKFVTSGTSSASFPINGYSGGVTIDPSGSTSGTTGSTDGSSSGGYPVGDPWGSLYNPSLGTGIQADPFAPTFAQQSGINGYQTANGFGTGTSASGDPVNMVTGNLIHSERDIAIKGRGGLPLVFERWYNSKSTKDGPLGFGWTHSFNHSLRFYGVESGVAKVSWTDGTGGERFFSTANHVSGNISVGAAFSGTAGVYATLERLTGGTYRLTERSGMQYVFESVNATATDTSQKSRLLSIADKNGNTLTLSYTAATGCTGTYVCKVTDSLNRALTFTYNGSRISQIADFTGRTWQYTYDTNNDLVTFKNSLAVAGTQPAVTYQYYGSLDGTKLAHAMKQYQLPRGNGMRFEYYANGRVFRHTPFDTTGSLKTDHATTFAWTEFRREAKQIDALGNERRFLFDANGNPLSITDEAGAETSYTYDTTAGRTHLRQSKTDPQGMTTAYAYDTLGNLSDVTLPSTRTLQYRDHTAYGQPKRVKDADGNWTLNRFNSAGNLTDVIRVKAGVTPTADTKPANADILAWTQFQADSAGNPVKTRSLRDWTTTTLGDATSGTGPSLETAWDANKLNRVSVTRRGDTDGTPVSLETDVYTDFVHDTLGRMTRGPDQNWYAADTLYDPLDRPIKTPDGRGHQWDTVYDANGNPLTVGLTINGAYLDGYYAAWDDLDRLDRKVDYAGNATLTQYDPLGRVSQITEADGYTIGFDRDAIGRVTGAYNQEGHRASLSLDADGRPRSSTDPNNLTTSYEYYHASEDGRLKKTTLPTVTGQAQGKAAEIASYDGQGRPTKINATAADGTLRDSYRFYDELGRLTREVGPQVSTTDSSRPVSCTVYTALSDVKEIWAGSTTDTTSKTCDLIGDANLKKQVSRTYDDFGRKLSETDQNGKVWKWTWNLHNQLVSSQTPTQIAAGQSTTYAYGTKGVTGETQGQLKQRSVPGAQTAVYTRDALGFVTKAETKNGSNSLVVAYDYAYDPAKRLQSVTDSRGNKQLSYTWTPGGRLAMVADSDGHQASMSYDATGRLASVTAPNGETIGFSYDAGGRLVETRLNSGQRTTQSWFEDGGLKQKQNLFNTTVLTSHLYTLDNQGRRSGQTETINASTKTWSYLYDNLDRLTEANDGTAETYGYDIFGNRRTKTRGATTTAYLYDDAHQLSEIRDGSDTGTLTGAAVHDADGHMVKLCEVSSGGTITQPAGDCTASGTGATTLALVWNALDHLNTATRTGANAIAESYAYDDSGRRISKTSAGTTTSYLYEGDAIHAEWTGSISGNPTAAYVHGAGIDEPLLRLTGTTSSPAATQAAYLQDGLGSVVGTTNVTGTLTANQRFDAWGNKTTSSGTIPQYGYTGREPDATGMTFYRARYYHPGIARFASRDPMGMADSVSPYAYVANNPINLIDPMGLEALLSGTPMSAAYWNMLADASFYTGIQTDVRDGGNSGTFTPGQQSLQNASGSSTLDKVQFGLDLLGLTEPFGVAADLVNAGISYGRGDALGGSLSLGAAIPVIGAAATTGKLGSKAADVLQANKAAGDAFEQAIGTELRATHEIAVPQITIKTPSGTRTRVDYVTRDGTQIGCVECKASATAPLTSNQASGFPEILQNGGVVVGKGKPGVPGGTVIPPGTQVIIRRP
ncbi:MAG: type IV secretion protein Rhs [Gammaproteobacteria bacterium]|nr:type IV secretion protein Rhs [Gammaproteobacteria bacterium]MBU1409725.1 type IV secretion protein Rhs [Gammaproteobacteria bacterium]